MPATLSGAPDRFPWIVRSVPATLSGAPEGSGGGCNSELGFCGMSGKSGGRIGGHNGRFGIAPIVA